MIPSTDRFGAAIGDIVRCARCGHAQVEPMPHEDQLTEAYEGAESTDYVDEEAGQRATARRMLERIEQHVPERGAILDLGCWVGFLLAEARERGWAVTGVEPSEFASAFARERLVLEVISGDLFSVALPSASFDVVTMNDLIEHLSDPGRALDRVHELLRHGGVLSLALPDAGSAVARVMGKRWWSVLPTHVQYFTRDSIGILLRDHGYRVLELSTSPKAFTVGYYLNRISGYSPALGRALVTGASAAGVAQRIWAPDFRDRMTVIARAV